MIPGARSPANERRRTVVWGAPGLFPTPLLHDLPPEVQASLGRQVPFASRLGHPQGYAETVLHVVKDKMLNGKTIRLDGAMRMAPAEARSG